MAEPVLIAENCSKWYGHVLGVSDIQLSVGGGVVGLLGPNGAGKSTLMKLAVGLLAPSRGAIRVFGESPLSSVEARRRIGYCPEHETLYDELSALEFVTCMAKLSGVPVASARDRAAAALEEMGLGAAKDRRIKGFSKGMRQRTKLAQALVHDPDLLILDEPMTGVDPIARAEITASIRKLADAGKTILLSTHVLYEIESLTEEIVVIYRGQVLAEGNMFEIRSLIDRHPHRIRVECDRPRELAKGLADAEHITRIEYERNMVTVETRDPDACYDQIAATVVENELVVRAMSSPDNNLAAVFDYLTGSSR